uniref:KH_10 domain-containing protein n=1 Tax=Elaeophora elaphi TaxID=1147741 RepID=A0A158Q816_9BILA
MTQHKLDSALTEFGRQAIGHGVIHLLSQYANYEKASRFGLTTKKTTYYVIGKANALSKFKHWAGNLNYMCECVPPGSMPIASHWALRGGFAPRANPRCPNLHSPHHDMNWKRHEFFVSFYHCSQESAKIFDAMKRRVELADEQRRKLEANRLQKVTSGNVMEYLERIPLSKNVTLTIEVPNSEHAGMIEQVEAWCDQDSIPQIMQETGVLVHFPDLVSDTPNAGDYVNRVTLTGPLANVEQARIRIKNFTPIAISFPLTTLKSHISTNNVKNIIDKAIAEKLINFPNLEIMVQLPQLAKDPVPFCVVRGTLAHEHDICDACIALHRLLFDAVSDDEHESAMIYATIIDIPAIQQPAVTGVSDGYLLQKIGSETRSVIYFPAVADRHFGATIFYLCGSVRAIMKARKYIQGLLPVSLIFDVENDDLLYPVDPSNREIFLRDIEHNVTIMMKKSRLEGEKLTTNDTLRNMVIIESEEYNLTNVYAVRRQLLRSGILQNEPLIVTNDFDFFKNDFRTLIAKNNQIIAESSSSLAKTSSLPDSQLDQKRESGNFLNRDMNDIAVFALGSGRRQRQTEEGIVTNTTSLSSIIAKEQRPSNGINMSVPQFMDLFKQNENNDVMISINDSGRPLTEVAVPQKMEHIKNTGKASSANQSFDEDSKEFNFHIIAGSATIAVAAAMLQNSPPEWFQSSDTKTALKSTQYLEHIPQMLEEKIISETFTNPTESAQSSVANSAPKNWYTKKNLPLKSSFINKNHVREYQRDIGTDTTDIPQGTARKWREISSDACLSALSGNLNTNPLYSLSNNNPAQNSNQNWSLHQNSCSTDDTHDYRTKRQPTEIKFASTRTRDSIVWENSQYSSSQLHNHHTYSNTCECQGRSSKGSMRYNGVVRGSRTIRQSVNYSGGYYPTFSRSQSTWSFSSSGYNENRGTTNRGTTPMRFKRQFVNRTQLEEKGKGDRQERYPSPHQERQHSYSCSQFRKDCEESNNNFNNITSLPKIMVKTTAYPEKMKRIDVMVLVNEVQRNQNEQASRSIQQTSRPALMMKELEKYTGSEKTSAKLNVDMSKQSGTEDVQNKRLVLLIVIARGAIEM